MRASDEIRAAKERAKTVDLPQIARDMGFSLIKSGRGYNCKEMDSMYFYMKNGQWKWKRFSQDIGGDSIAFVQEFTDHKNFMDALNYLVGDEMTYHCVRITENPIRPEPPKVFEKPTETRDTRRTWAYLTKTRGLESNLVNKLIKDGHISQEKPHGNVIFKIKDEKDNYIGAEMVGTYTGSRFKQISEGLKEGYGFEVCRGEGTSAMFFESAIDMLSFMQIHPETQDCRFISMGGLKHTIIEQTAARYNIAAENIYICSDNDEKGNLFSKKMKDEFPEMHRLTPPVGKDWNDYLKSDTYAKEKALAERCKELSERINEKIKQANGLFEDIVINKCVDTLNAIGISATAEEFAFRISDKSVENDMISEKNMFIYNCLEEVTHYVFEAEYGDYECTLTKYGKFAFENLNNQQVAFGNLDEVLKGFEDRIKMQLVIEREETNINTRGE